MKKIINISFLFFAALLLFASCDVSVNKDTYTPKGDEVSFLTNVFSDIEIPATQPTIEVSIARGKADGALSVPITANIPGVNCPSTVNFNAGEYETTLTLDLTGMEIGKAYKGTISIDKSVINEHIAFQSISVTLQKAYNWVSLGKGQFYDDWFIGGPYDVEIVKADGFEIYRVMNPYPKDIVVQEGLTPGKGISYIEFSVADGKVSYTNLINLGFSFSGMDCYFADPLWLQDDAKNKALNIVVEEKLWQLVWYPILNYNAATGGFSWWGSTSVAYISLPGGPDLEKYLE